MPQSLIAITRKTSWVVYVGGAEAGATRLFARRIDQLDSTLLTAETAGSPFVSPDGEWIAFVADGKVKRVPRLGGSAITVADSANGEIPALAWLEDGTILFNNPGFNLQAISVDGGPQRRSRRGHYSG